MYLFIYAIEYWNISFPASSSFGALLSTGFLIISRSRPCLEREILSADIYQNT